VAGFVGLAILQVGGGELAGLGDVVLDPCQPERFHVQEVAGVLLGGPGPAWARGEPSRGTVVQGLFQAGRCAAQAAEEIGTEIDGEGELKSALKPCGHLGGGGWWGSGRRSGHGWDFDESFEVVFASKDMVLCVSLGTCAFECPTCLGTVVLANGQRACQRGLYRICSLRMTNETSKGRASFARDEVWAHRRHPAHNSSPQERA
jgi:hypothetical protein